MSMSFKVLRRKETFNSKESPLGQQLNSSQVSVCSSQAVHHLPPEANDYPRMKMPHKHDFNILISVDKANQMIETTFTSQSSSWIKAC